MAGIPAEIRRLAGTVKVVLGFLELAMAIKFLSNADLVEQWGLVKREVFIGFWVVIGVLITLLSDGENQVST